MDPLHQLWTLIYHAMMATQNYPSVFLVIIVVVAGVFTWIISYKFHSAAMGVIVICILVGATYYLSQNSSLIFQKLDTRAMYHEFFTDMSTNFISTLVISLIYVIWQRARDLLITFLIAVLIAVLSFGFLALAPLVVKPLLSSQRNFLTDLEFEMVSGFATTTISILIIGFLLLVRSRKRGIPIIITILCLFLLCLITAFSLEQNKTILTALQASFIGGTISNVLLGNWATTDYFFYRLVVVLLVSISIIILIYISSYQQDFTLNLVSEFVGALFSTTLLEGAPL